MAGDDYEAELAGSRADIAAALHGIADGIRAGRVRLGEDADAVAAAVSDDLSLEIELETDGDEVELELELEWAAPADGPAVSSVDEAAVEPTGDDPPAEVSTDGDEADAAAAEAVPDPVPAGAADGSTSLARFELFRDRADEWRWRLRHRNGNVIATGGEGYTRKHNAVKGLRSVMANAPGATVSETD